MKVLSVLLLALPVSAAAADQSADEVTFESTINFFRGQEASAEYPEGGDIRLQLITNIEGSMDIRMTGQSQLTWPDGTLVHGWTDNKRAGEMSFTSKASMKLNVAFDIFGFSGGYVMWDDSYTWTVTTPFAGLLLPGSDVPSVTVDIPAALEDVLKTDPYYPTEYDIYIELSGSVYPRSTATITGESIKSNNKEVNHLASTVELRAPDENDGYLPMNSTWNGSAEASFLARVVPTVSICEDYLFGFCYDWDMTEFTWGPPNDVRPIRSDAQEYELAIPGLDAETGVIDLGEVVIGEAAVENFSLKSLSNATLYADLAVEGGGFSLTGGNSVQSSGSPATVQIVFNPTSEGEFTGELVLTTNDILREEVRIPVRGEGVLAPVEEPDDTDEEEETGDDNYVDELNGGCACDSTPNGAGAFGVLGVAALLGMRRRRA